MGLAVSRVLRAWRAALVGLWLLVLLSPGGVAAPQAGPELKPLDPSAKAIQQASARLRSGTPASIHPRIQLNPPDPAEGEVLKSQGGSFKAQAVGFNRPLPRVALDGQALSWQPVSGGQAAVFSVGSPGAAALRLRLVFSASPVGLELRFFPSAQPAHALGPVTLETLPGYPAPLDYWSPVVEGETLAVELFLPAGADPGDLRMTVPELSHLVVSLLDPATADKNLSDIGDSGSCNIDVACDNTDVSDATIDATAKYIYTSGGSSFLCTGTLLSDADPGSFEPYFLTANHCVSTQSEASTLNLYWFFQRASCGGPNPTSVVQTFNGGTLLANSSATDFSLINLNQAPPGGVGFAGWTADQPAIDDSVFGIHHPAGDLKKISYGAVEDFTTVNSSATIEVLWSQGVTEGGSSGSGLFDSNERLLGQLLGGFSACSQPGSPDYYGRFDQTYPSIAQFIDAAPPGGPDLLVQSPTVSDATLGSGQSFSLGATVLNSGDETASSTTLRYYRSTNSTISTGDLFLGSDPVDGLAAGASSPESITVTAPTTPGNYYVGACVDTVSGETDTDNNCSAGVLITVSASPDLVVNPVSVNDTTPDPGASLGISATVVNQGNDTSPATTLRYYRSSNAIISNTDLFLGSDPVGSLASGQSGVETISVSAPTAPGDYYLGACVDAVSGESDAGNNCSIGVLISVSNAADLVVDAPTLSTTTPTVGGTINIATTVRNQGEVTASSTTLRYYRSSNPTITTGDLLLGTDGVSSLVGGGSSPESITVSAPSTPGDYYLGACVDAVSGESDTGNNCSAGVLISVSSAADLVVETPSLSTLNPGIGEAIDMDVTVRNQGGVTAASSMLRYYRSGDATITTGDLLLGLDAVNSLAAGASATESLRFSAPTSAGDYYLGACVDPVSGEQPTTNNCSSGVRISVGSSDDPARFGSGFE